MNCLVRNRGGPPGRTVAPFGLGGVLALFLLTVTAGAQITTPLLVGALQPIRDEFGEVLQGNANVSKDQRDLVVLLWATNQMIYPPDFLGNPHPANPPVEGGVSGIGSLVSPRLERPGFFSIALLRPRPLSGTFFVRVFNAPKLEDASFYGDSQLLTISGNKVLIAYIDSTRYPLDARDNDQDGLNNSWEKSYGSDPNKIDTDGDGLTDGEEHRLSISPVLADTDGDGMLDGEEVRAGTAPKDPKSLLLMARIRPAGGDDAIIGWDSVPGKKYRVQYTGDLLNEEPEFIDVSGVVEATAELTETLVPGGMLIDRGQYRVRLIEE